MTRTVWETVRRITNEILMISCEKYVRIIIHDSSFLSEVSSIRNVYEEKERNRCYNIFLGILISIIIVVLSFFIEQGRNFSSPELFFSNLCFSGVVFLRILDFGFICHTIINNTERDRIYFLQGKMNNELE